MSEQITTVCIPTCNRPESLKLALSGLTENLNKYGRSPRILIVDDSEVQENSLMSRNIILSFSNSYGGKIEIIDRQDRVVMAMKLAKERGLDEEVVKFGLLGDKTSTTTIGSVQNTFLLKTRGEKIVMVDDDVLYKFFSTAKNNDPFLSFENPLEYIFLEENHKPTDFFNGTEIDFLSIHESIMGNNLEKILGKDTPEYMKDFKIIDTYMGSFGDSPMQSHIPLLTLPQVYEKYKNISLSEYQNIKKARRILIAPKALSVYQGFMCISMVMGIDNSNLTPLFIPIGRAQDLVFGITRYKAFPLKLSAHLPILIQHERPIKELMTPDHNYVREITKMNRVVSSLIDEILIDATDPTDNLNIIGDRLISISSESDMFFSLFMEQQCIKNTRSNSMYFNHILSTSKDYPDFWRKDIESIKNSLMIPNSKDFLYDINKNQVGNALPTLRQWLLLYGQLLKSWATLTKY